MNASQSAPKGPVARLVGFALIILVLAVLGGVVTLFYDYVMKYRAETWSEREESKRRVESDSTSAMKKRFVIGAGTGALIGIVYMVRCLGRREDP